MNASNRSLNVALMALALCLVTVAIWLFFRPASAPEWLSPATLETTDATAGKTPVMANPDLDTFANTWQSPLFSPSRTPDNQPVVARASPDLAGIKLTGVIVGGGQRIALLNQADGRDLKVSEGNALANGWTLKRVEPLAVVFEYNGNVRELLLPAPRVQNSVKSPTQNVARPLSGERK